MIWLRNATSIIGKLYEKICVKDWAIEEAHKLVIVERQWNYEITKNFFAQTTTLTAWIDLFAKNLNPEPLHEFQLLLLGWSYPGTAHGPPKPLAKLEDRLASAVRILHRLGVILRYKDEDYNQAFEWLLGPFGLQISPDYCFVKRIGMEQPSLDFSRSFLSRYWLRLLVEADGNIVPLEDFVKTIQASGKLVTQP